MSVELLEEYIAADDLGNLQNALLMENPALRCKNSNLAKAVSPLIALSCYYKKPEVEATCCSSTYTRSTCLRLRLWASLTWWRTCFIPIPTR